LTDRGFGFIMPRDGGKDVYFHARECRDRFDDLREGDKVEFQMGIDKMRGKEQAEEVTLLN